MSAELETSVLTGDEKKEIIETSAEKKVIEEEEAAVTAAAAAAAAEKDGLKEKEPVSKDKETKEAPPPPPRVHKTDFEKDVVYLYQFSRTPIVPSLSPYCLKVETWLRLTGLKYQVIRKWNC